MLLNRTVSGPGRKQADHNIDNPWPYECYCKSLQTRKIRYKQSIAYNIISSTYMHIYMWTLLMYLAGHNSTSEISSMGPCSRDFLPCPGAPCSLRHCVVVTVSLLGCLRLQAVGTVAMGVVVSIF